MNSANTNPRLPDAADELPMDTMPLVVLKQFRVIYGSVRQHFRDVEQRCGVSGSQLWLLHEIAHTPGVGVSELAARLSIHQSTCSQLVDKLEARGLISKARKADDQRRVGVQLTDQAAEVLAPKVDAIFVSKDNFVVSALNSLTDTAMKYKVPVISADPSSAPSSRVLAAYGLMGLPLAFVALPIYVHLPKLYADFGLSLASIGAVLALAIAFLRITYAGGRGRRRLIESLLCGLITLAAATGTHLLGIPQEATPFLGGVVGLLGIDIIRDRAKQMFGKEENNHAA